MLFPDDKYLKIESNKEFKRLQTLYVNKSQKFEIKVKDYSEQFFHLYASRLKGMHDLLKQKVEQKYGDKYPIKKLFELREENPIACIIIGTLYKDQKLKPSVLRELSEENQLAPQPPRDNYVDEEDKLILEDDLQRIILIGNFDKHNLVTGVVCAILGYEKPDGRFGVEEITFYEGGPQKPLKTLDSSPLLLLISGIDQSSENDFTMSLELLQQWIFGNLDGFGDSQDWEAAGIVRIIVAGNSIRATPEYKKKSLITRKAEVSVRTIDALTSCDKIFSHLSKSVYVDVMPGEFDPSNFMLPQQPMHQFMFPKSSVLKSFQCVTNPYHCEVAERTILGTSGQNVVDIMRVTNLENPLEALRMTLVWGHLSPTCPDTLSCYPYKDRDPFIMDGCPHVYFAGNQSKFSTDLYKGPDGQTTRLICIPSFSRTQSVAIVNLRTLECKDLNFKVNSFEE